MSTDKMKIIVDVDGTKKGSAEFDRMRIKTEGVERAVGQLRNKLLLFTFAAAAVTAVVTKLTSASIEQEKIFNTLENSINITGESYDNLKVSLDGYFASLQQSTIYGDTDTAQVLQKLIILTGDYDTALIGLPLSLDLAASGLFDVGTAARMVGMALTGNIEMLGRYIPEFKAATNEALKNMDASEKVAFAIETLQEKFGGLAEKELNTTAGQWEQFKNYWGDLKEALGDVLLPLERISAYTDFFKLLLGVQENQSLQTRAEFLKEYIELSNEERLNEQIRISEIIKNNEKEIKLNNDIVSSYDDKTDSLAAFLGTGKNLSYMATTTTKMREEDEKRIKNAQLEVQVLEQMNEEYKRMLGWTADVGLNLGEFKVINDIAVAVENLKEDLEEIEDIEIGGIITVQEIELSQFKEYLKVQREEIYNSKRIAEWNAKIIEQYPEVAKAMGIVEEKVEELGELQKNMMQMTSNAMADIMVNAFDDGFDKIGEMFTRLLKRMLAEFIATQLMKLFIDIATSGLANLGSRIRPPAVELSVPSSPNLPSVPNTQPITSVSPSTGGATLDDVVIALGNMVVLSDVETARFVERGEAKRIY